MQALRVLARSLILSAILVVGSVGFLQCRDSGVFTPAAAQRARYQMAQRQTVLVATERGQGSGFTIVRKDYTGVRHVFVWTAAHVVEGHNTAKVKLVLRHAGSKSGITVFDARVVHRSKVDAALLEVKADPTLFENTEFDFSVPQVGTPIHHVGNLFGIAFDDSLTTGILSQIGVRPDESWPWPLADQTSALAVPGSSGGPIFNSINGKVLGILVGGPGVAGISLYVPVRELERVVTPDWALRGSWCPSQSLLDSFAEEALTK